MSDIKFGTDGWRAVLGKDFNYKNTDKVINAAATYIYNEFGFDKPIIIGYDPRNKADDFAFYIARKLSEFGFDVEISEKIIATPVLAYTALKKSAYAIMLTASHNPPEYLGIKIIPPYGGPADDNITNKITLFLNSDFTVKSPNIKPFKKSDFEDDYIKHISSIIDFEIIKKSGLKINYDGHHGAAAKLFKYILDINGIENHSINLERDINFGGMMPDPKEKYLPELKKLCKETKHTGVSNDGDGDRFGVFNENGEFVTPNEIIVLLLKHLVKNKNYTGKLAKTVGASSMLDVYAQKLNIEVVETAVGFKWLGEAMRNDDIIIAGEESGGLSIKGHIPEKDGILANLLIMEMLAYCGKTLFELQSELRKTLNRVFINDRIDLTLSADSEINFIFEKFKTINKINEYKIIKKNTTDGLKLYLEDNGTILIRKSGTEPLLRIYFETDKEEKLMSLESAVKQLCLK